jgi:uncharacterized membrane protein
MVNFIESIPFRTIKILNIGYLGIIYSVLTITISILIDKIMPKYDEKEYNKKEIYIIILECFLSIVLIMIGVYFIRNIVQVLPYPLDNIKSFDHTRLKELNGGVLLAFFVVTFQQNLKNKILHVTKRLNII